MVGMGDFLRVAVNGFGRIGKCFLKAAIERNLLGKTFEVVAINTRSEMDMHIHLFKYDSVYGRWKGNVKKDGEHISFDGYRIRWIRETDPLKLPWKELEIDVVLESTGELTEREEATKHLVSGAKKILLSAPGKNADVTIVPGVNDEAYDGKQHSIISMGSCTTNCLAPVLNVLNNKFGILNGFMSTVHAYTNDQRILDGTHRDYRRARAGAVSIIPTTTGAARAIGLVIPELDKKMDGVAYRVPVLCGSLNDMTLNLSKEAIAKEINGELKRASEQELEGIMEYCEDPIVSCDVIRNPHSAIIDAQLTRVIGRTVRVAAWYDNEWGFSNRLVELIPRI